MPKLDPIKPPNLKALGIVVPAEGEVEPDFIQMDHEATDGISAVYKTGSREVRAIIRAMFNRQNPLGKSSLLETIYQWQLDYERSLRDDAPTTL